MKNKFTHLLPLLCLIGGVGTAEAQQTHIIIPDTRNDATPVEYYDQRLKADFKFATSVDAQVPGYVTVVGLRGWVDDSGGPAHQVAFHDSKLLWRAGYAWGWRGWKEFVLANPDGNVGIGTATPDEKLAVNGNIRAKEIKVEATNWPDYVFKQDYELMPLKEVEQHILQHGHLPDIPKAVQIEEEGLSLGEMNKLLLKKVEELTLYLIEKNKKMRKLEDKVEQLQNSIIDFKTNPQ